MAVCVVFFVVKGFSNLLLVSPKWRLGASKQAVFVLVYNRERGRMHRKKICSDKIV